MQANRWSLEPRSGHRRSKSSRTAVGLCLIVSGLVLGCAGQQKPSPAPAATATTTPSTSSPVAPVSAKPVEMSLRIDAISTSKGLMSLQPGDSLRSGDQIAISVSVDQPAYVYIAVASSTEAPKIIFPKNGDQQVMPGQALRIPSNAEKWIPLDFKVGQDDIFAYAAPRPIPNGELLNLISTDADAAKKAFAKRAAKSASKPAAKPAAKPAKPGSAGPGKPGSAGPSQEPAGLSADSRGLTISDDDSETDALPAAPAHITAKRFFLVHK